MAHLYPYLVARHVAADRDRAGLQPPLILRVVVGIGSLAMLGVAVCFVLAALDFLAWKAGLI